MTDLDETTCEQLSAWMDGALPPDEARFLERRLQHDAALRMKFERLQLASSMLRGHGVRPMPAALPDRIAQAIAVEAPARAGKPWMGWAVAASVALAALVFATRYTGVPAEAPQIADATPAAATPAPVASVPATPSVDAPHQATPGSADFLASADVSAAPAIATIATADPASTPGALASPAEFPLDPSAPPKSWPRSAAPGGAEAELEGYLVRHSEMAGGDALGGFVPYLDVVAGEDAAAPAAPAPERK
jgi:negative regulator of sigma E activity